MENTPKEFDVYHGLHIDLGSVLEHYQENKHRGKKSHFLTVTHSGIVKNYSVQETLSLFGF
jgi:hypothetical protein